MFFFLSSCLFFYNTAAIFLFSDKKDWTMTIITRRLKSSFVPIVSLVGMVDPAEVKFFHPVLPGHVWILQHKDIYSKNREQSSKWSPPSSSVSTLSLLSYENDPTVVMTGRTLRSSNATSTSHRRNTTLTILPGRPLTLYDSAPGEGDGFEAVGGVGACFVLEFWFVSRWNLGFESVYCCYLGSILFWSK